MNTVYMLPEASVASQASHCDQVTGANDHKQYIENRAGLCVESAKVRKRQVGGTAEDSGVEPVLWQYPTLRRTSYPLFDTQHSAVRPTVEIGPAN
jgi:hypothetical protein